ncbi:hypothetical protein ACIA5D_25920 [Actinoplanes sp. NPDC051513]|uniref:hypothetical protein n=1 Tax=Actinoplanes sp. NPDC051513 TaxID=3363908 RepID=UPI0037B4D696
MAWPLLSPPDDSVGELSPDDEEEEEEDEDDEDDEDESSVVVDVVDVVEVDVSAAWAATPTATVPATLAATKAPVISEVRRSPVSRFICVAHPLSLMTGVDDERNPARRVSLLPVRILRAGCEGRVTVI